MRDNENKATVVQENTIDYKEINDKIGLNNIKVEKKPLLTISSRCHNHIRALHKEYPGTEWLAICKVENLGNGHFQMTDMIHPQQKGVSGEVETTDDGMDRAVDYLIEKGEDLSKRNLILHSHHKMGCFWSGTDDKARLGLNDGRTLARAVVTAYAGDTISYKGCLNFYKPYPIEIDCDIEYETENLYQQVVECGDYLKGRTQEIYNEKVGTDKTLSELQCEYDYSRVLEYLGIDILKELKENAKVVTMKMPCEDYEKRLEEIMEEAEKEAKDELGLPTDSELVKRAEWSNGLLEQLKEARNIPTKATEYNTSPYRYSDYHKTYDSRDDYDRGCISSISNPILESNRDFYDSDYMGDGFYMYNTTNFTKSELINMLGLNEQVRLMSNQDGLWLIHNNVYDKWEYIGDVIEFYYDYEDDYL